MVSAGSHGNISGNGRQGLSWAPAAVPSAHLERVGPWHYQNDKEPPDERLCSPLLPAQGLQPHIPGKTTTAAGKQLGNFARF